MGLFSKFWNKLRLFYTKKLVPLVKEVFNFLKLIKDLITIHKKVIIPLLEVVICIIAYDYPELYEAIKEIISWYS